MAVEGQRGRLQGHTKSDDVRFPAVIRSIADIGCAVICEYRPSSPGRTQALRSQPADPLPAWLMHGGLLRHSEPGRRSGQLGHSGFLSGRSTSSYEGTWVLSCHDSSAAPQTAQIASPVCGTKNFSSVRRYLAPQLH
jgi:hypothetical protein